MKFLFVEVVWCLFPSLSPGLVAGGSRLQAEALGAAAARADLCNLVQAGGEAVGWVCWRCRNQGRGWACSMKGSWGHLGMWAHICPSLVVPGGRGPSGACWLPAPVPPPGLYLLAGKGFATLRGLLSAAGLCLCPLHRPHV